MLRSCPFLLAAAFAAASASGQVADAPAVEPRTFEVTAHDYKFDPELLEVTEGDKVVLKIKSTDGKKHGLAIKELGVKVTVPKSGEVVTATFVAGKPGTYSVACSEYCGSGHSRMKGRLVVAARAR